MFVDGTVVIDVLHVFVLYWGSCPKLFCFALDGWF